MNRARVLEGVLILIAFLITTNAVAADEIATYSCTYRISYKANAMGTVVAEDSRFEINKTRNTVNGHPARVSDGSYGWHPTVPEWVKEDQAGHIMIIHTRTNEFQHISLGEIIGDGKCRIVRNRP